MLQIRRSTFETNSSSTHSITMCTGDEYNKFVEGKVVLNNGYWKGLTAEFKNNTFVTIQQFLELVKEDSKDDTVYKAYEECHTVADCYKRDADIDDDMWFDDILSDYTCESYERLGGEQYEVFEDRYTTPGGEEVVAFGYYGYDY